MNNKSTAWGGVADQLVNTWTEVGTQMWKSWFDLMGTATQEAMGNTGLRSSSIAQRFFENQQLLLRTLQLSFNTWKESFPKTTTGEDWQHFLQNYSEQIRQQFEQSSTGTFKATQDVTELWQLYLTELQDFSQLWLRAMTSSVTPLQQTVSGTSTPWLELNNLYWNLLYEESSGSLMRSPLLGPSREFNGKLLRAFDAWAIFYRNSIDYQTVLTDIQMRSFEALIQQLATLAENGEPVKDWRQFQQIWGRVADEVYEQAFCAEDNLKIRGRFLNSLNTYRIYQQDLMELWMKLMNLPSRGEVDEVHKNIYELRKEVRALKASLAKYEAQVEVHQPTAPHATTDTLAASADGDSGTAAPHPSVTSAKSSDKPPAKSRKQPPEEPKKPSL
ncbi:class III poly(R)-hydroxyalkanoic acid synthase subunit PhaE [Pantanalinema rosaneae CENA516]|uniref:class III poly(R)-hydroxyalkanoic acid synthase subunit PhaE n=1 Tax=Pantanalinema rosaneae TaxID=1620701 RepID=UPI003D6FFB1A